MQLKQFLTQVASAAGISADKLKALDSITGDIADDVATPVVEWTQRVFDEEGGKHSSTLKAHFQAQALNTVDKTLEELYDELGIDPDSAAELKGVKSTYERTKAALRKVKDLTEKKAAAKSGDKAVLQEEISKLNKQVIDLNAKMADEISKVQKSAQGDVLDFALMSSLTGQQYANKDIPADVQAITAKTLLQNALAKNKAKVVLKDKQLVLVNSDHEDLDYTEQNKSISFGDFVKRELANSKMLEVSGSQPPKPAVSKKQLPNGNDNIADVSNILSANEQQLAQLEGTK